MHARNVHRIVQHAVTQILAAHIAGADRFRSVLTPEHVCDIVAHVGPVPGVGRKVRFGETDCRSACKFVVHMSKFVGEGRNGQGIARHPSGNHHIG